MFWFLHWLEGDIYAESDVGWDWISEIRVFGIDSCEVLALYGEKILGAYVET